MARAAARCRPPAGQRWPSAGCRAPPSSRRAPPSACVCCQVGYPSYSNLSITHTYLLVSFKAHASSKASCSACCCRGQRLLPADHLQQCGGADQRGINQRPAAAQERIAAQVRIRQQCSIGAAMQCNNSVYRACFGGPSTQSTTCPFLPRLLAGGSGMAAADRSTPRHHWLSS